MDVSLKILTLFLQGAPPPVIPPAYGFQVCVWGRSFALNTRFFFITHFSICHSFLDSYIERFLVRFWISHYLKKKLKYIAGHKG